MLKLQLFQLLFPLCIILYLNYSHLHPHLTIKSLFHQLPIGLVWFWCFVGSGFGLVGWLVGCSSKNQPLLVLVL